MSQRAEPAAVWPPCGSVHANGLHPVGSPDVRLRMASSVGTATLSDRHNTACLRLPTD